MLKNVVIINDFNYVQGGASKIAIETAKILKDDGLNVYFFSADNKEEENIEGIKYISTEQKEALREKNKLKGIINGIYNFKSKRKLKELLKQLDKENTIIHVHGWTKALSSSIFDIIFKLNFNVVLTLHDYFTACPNGGYFNYKKNYICSFAPLSYKCIMCNCDSRNYFFKFYRLIRQFVQNKIVKINNRLENVISISKFSEKILKKTLGKNIKITRIYNPIEMEENEFVDVTKNKYFLYVGRVDQEKGVDLFCQAITDLNKRGIVVGTGNEIEKLRKNYPNIEFVGWKRKEDVKNYMKGARAFIFPSRWYETAGLTVLEAMSLGIPCIVSKNTAASEFIEDGKNGLLFENLKDLEEKIKNVDNIKLEFIDIKKFNKLNYKNKIIELYNKILLEGKI